MPDSAEACCRSPLGRSSGTHKGAAPRPGALHKSRPVQLASQAAAAADESEDGVHAPLHPERPWLQAVKATAEPHVRSPAAVYLQAIPALPAACWVALC